MTYAYARFRPRRPHTEVHDAPLGLDPRDSLYIIQRIREGLGPESVDQLAKLLGLSRGQTLELLGVPPTTFSRRRRQGTPLSAQESDRIYRVLVVFQAAVELFEGDEARTREWLFRPAQALAGQPPLSMLDTLAGVDEVRTLIGRLENGIIV